jgi:BirA family biotin operon repressor/biotin-[acetyl-CoA-carboxylase] ligase
MLFSPEKVIRLQSVGSTNEFMIGQIRQGKINKEGTVVVAADQTSGRGLGQNAWESEKGKNLTFSIFFKPLFLRAEQQFLLNKSISLGVYDFVKTTLPGRKTNIKWPNDIYVENNKLAGILINNTIEGNELLHSVAGIGININQDKFSNRVRNPVSLKQLIRKEVDLNQVLDEILYYIENRYSRLVTEDPEQMNIDYLLSLYRFNEYFLYRYNDKEIYARITGISDYGHLQLVTGDNGQIECDFKEIEFII